MGTLSKLFSIYDYLSWLYDSRTGRKPDMLPSGAPIQAIVGAGAWAYGAWVEISASTFTDLRVYGVFCSDDTALLGGQIQVGVGALGAEAAVLTIPVTNLVTTYIPLWAMPKIASGSRVSFRCANSAGGGVNGFHINLLTHKDGA